MLTADYIASLPDELVDLFSDVEAEIMQSVVSRVQKTKALTPSSVYQLEKLRDLGKLNSDVTKTLANAMGVSQKKVKKLLQDAGIESLAVDDAIYRAAGKAPLAVAKSAAMCEVLAAGIRKTNGLLKNFTGTTASTARMAYSNILDKAYLEVTSGAYSYQDAIRRAVKTLSKQGVTRVAYPAGGQDTIETSVRKCIVTGVNQTVSTMQLARAKEMDSDLVEVSAHAGARPSHAEWQGGIYSISGKHPHYGSLYAITGYGTIEGLCGINCYHSFYPYFEGLSSLSFERDPARRLGKTNDQVYEENQNQRVYERRVRESRRECATLDEAMSNAESEADKVFFKREFEKASVLLKKREDALRSYCHSIGRRVETERLTVGGFGRSTSSKAVWAERKIRTAEKVGTQAGGNSGAKKTAGWEDRHAKRYYAEVRKRAPGVDAAKIAKHTSFTESAVEEIRQHVFINEHILDGKPQRFVPSFEQAQAWQRLVEGHGTDIDVMFLKHEYVELTQMRLSGYTYDEAHAVANRKHDWWEALNEGGDK